MPRPKKDGRYINYYLENRIFEKLKRYAQERGQPMTAALERIIEEYLDRYEQEKPKKGGRHMYCPNCLVLYEGARCPICASGRGRPPEEEEEYCFLTEKDAMWSGALSDILRQNDIPHRTTNVLGAGLSMHIGPMRERVRFFVPYAFLEDARALAQEFFAE